MEETKPKHILVVDDHEGFRKLLSRTLTGEGGYNVTTAEDGMDALEKFGDGKEFDLVITDLSMPKLNGIDLAEKLSEISPQTPRVLHSSTKLPIGDLMPGLFNAVLIKPVDIQLLLDTVELIFRPA